MGKGEGKVSMQFVKPSQHFVHFLLYKLEGEGEGEGEEEGHGEVVQQEIF